MERKEGILFVPFFACLLSVILITLPAAAATFRSTDGLSSGAAVQEGRSVNGTTLTSRGNGPASRDTKWPVNYSFSAGDFRGACFDGSAFWMVPKHADRVIRVSTDPSTLGNMSSYGPSGESGVISLWPSGFIKSTWAFYGAAFDGVKIWLAPYYADRVISLQISDGTMLGYGPIATTSNWPTGFSKPIDAFSSATFDGNYIWLSPMNADRIIRIASSNGDMSAFGPATNTLSEWPVGYSGVGTHKFDGIVFDGESVHLVPHNADRVVRVNVSSASSYVMSCLGTTDNCTQKWPTGFSPPGAAKFVGAAFDGASLWLAPNTADRIIRFPLDNVTANATAYGPATDTVTQWPANFAIPGGQYYFAGAVYDGAAVWFIPEDANRLVRLQVSDGVMSGVGPNDGQTIGLWPFGFAKGQRAFIGGLLDGRGSLWMIPNEAIEIVRVFGDVWTDAPTLEPTLVPTTIEPTFSPTFEPTLAPTSNPTVAPTLAPTTEPTLEPTLQPTTAQPSFAPTEAPTTSAPTYAPTLEPSLAPTTLVPTFEPTRSPTFEPTASPTFQPTAVPTFQPTTALPTFTPTMAPMSTVAATAVLTFVPTAVPTPAPTFVPTAQPTPGPTFAPTAAPTVAPTTTTVTPATTTAPTTPPPAPSSVPSKTITLQQQPRSSLRKLMQTPFVAVPGPLRGAISVNSVVAGLMGSPQNAVASQRTNLIANLGVCSVRQEEDDDGNNNDRNPLPISDSPTRGVIGSTPYRFHMGAMVFNLVVIVGAAVVTGCFLVPIHMLYRRCLPPVNPFSQNHQQYPTGFFFSFVELRGLSLVVVVTTVMLQPTAQSASVVIAVGTSLEAIAASAVLLLLLGLVMWGAKYLIGQQFRAVFLWKKSYRTRNEEKGKTGKSGCCTSLKWWFTPVGEWRARLTAPLPASSPSAELLEKRRNNKHRAAYPIVGSEDDDLMYDSQEEDNREEERKSNAKDGVKEEDGERRNHKKLPRSQRGFVARLMAKHPQCFPAVFGPLFDSFVDERQWFFLVESCLSFFIAVCAGMGEGISCRFAVPMVVFACTVYVFSLLYFRPYALKIEMVLATLMAVLQLVVAALATDLVHRFRSSVQAGTAREAQAGSGGEEDPVETVIELIILGLSGVTLLRGMLDVGLAVAAAMQAKTLVNAHVRRAVKAECGAGGRLMLTSSDGGMVVGAGSDETTKMNYGELTDQNPTVRGASSDQKNPKKMNIDVDDCSSNGSAGGRNGQQHLEARLLHKEEDTDDDDILSDLKHLAHAGGSSSQHSQLLPRLQPQQQYSPSQEQRVESFVAEDDFCDDL